MPLANPYGSPQSTDLPFETTNDLSRGSAIGWRLIRAFALALVGYGVFVEGGKFYCETSLNRTFGFAEDWIVGTLIALVFASSEYLNAGCGRSAGIVRRMLVSSALMLAVILITAFVGSAVGLRATSYDQTRPMCLFYTALMASFFIVGLFVVRFRWIGSREFQHEAKLSETPP
jgi:hypothetical protein